MVATALSRSPVRFEWKWRLPMSDGDDDQPPHDERQRQRSRSRDRVHPHAQTPQAPQVPQIQPMDIQEPVTERDEDPAVVNPSSPSAGPSPSSEQRGRSRRQLTFRSRERAPPHVPPHARQQPQPAAPPPREQQIQPLAIQGAGEESATVDPQSRVSDRSRSPTEKRKSTGTKST